MGNRVKGRPKKKSIKAATHSGLSAKRKLSRYGKIQKKNHAGLDATFIGRAKVLKKLQISLKDFRRLCILKGVYPREPRGRAPKNKKGQVFYHIKDVKAIAHEPILEKFREFKAFMKKVRKSANRHEKDEARRKEALAPKYTLHHLVKERYPRFTDALGDLDDALCLVHLFAALPSDGRVKSGITRKAQLLCASWGAYCAVTGSVTKSFISVKGVYFEADVRSGAGGGGEGVNVRWVMPHNFTQYIPEGVDFRVMLTFFEFYETLLGFVLFKLYADIGLRYPLPTAALSAGNAAADSEGGVSGSTSAAATSTTSTLLHPTLGGKATSVLAANLMALQNALQEASKGNLAAKAVKDSMNDSGDTAGSGDAVSKETSKDAKLKKKKQKQLMQSIDEALKGVDQEEDDDNDDADDMEDDDENQVPIAEPLREALQAISDDNDKSDQDHSTLLSTHLLQNPQAQKRNRLFHNLTFFLSREIPRGYLELIILSFGGTVGWEGSDSPISMNDPSITHHIVDRPKLLPSYEKLPKSREFVQPQWIVDCANYQFVLPIKKYGVGRELPPHLSPWVEDKEEGYVPKYKEEVERLKNGEVLEEEDEGGSVDDAVEEEVDVKTKEVGSDEEESSEEEESEEKKVEEKDDKDEDGSEESESEEEEEEEDEEEMERKQIKKKQSEDDEAKELAKALMSKKAARLYGRMQHGIAQKQAKVDNLHKKRREIESTKERTDGKSFQKLKVERLKKERREVEEVYEKSVNEGGGSMKKKRRKN